MWIRNNFEKPRFVTQKLEEVNLHIRNKNGNPKL